MTARVFLDGPVFSTVLFLDGAVFSTVLFLDGPAS
jgi:hypothetical protein